MYSHVEKETSRLSEVQALWVFDYKAKRNDLRVIIAIPYINYGDQYATIDVMSVFAGMYSIARPVFYAAVV